MPQTIQNSAVLGTGRSSAKLLPFRRPDQRCASRTTVSVERDAPESSEQAVEQAGQIFWLTVTAVVLTLAVALSGAAGPAVETGARELLLAPFELAYEAWDALMRIDWSYGLARCF